MRNYAGGYLRGDSGTALVEVTGLKPNRNYDFGVSVYCSDHCANHYLLVLPNGNKLVPKMHETCCLNLQTNQRLSCDVGIRGCTGASFDPVYTGVYTADSTGKVVFGFEHEKSDSNPMVKFSGIKIRSCNGGFDTWNGDNFVAKANGFHHDGFPLENLFDDNKGTFRKKCYKRIIPIFCN